METLNLSIIENLSLKKSTAPILIAASTQQPGLNKNGRLNKKGVFLSAEEWQGWGIMASVGKQFHKRGKDLKKAMGHVSTHTAPPGVARWRKHPHLMISKPSSLMGQNISFRFRILLRLTAISRTIGCLKPPFKATRVGDHQSVLWQPVSFVLG